MAILYVESVIRGHHIYKSIWNPVIGEDLEVRREPENVHDRRAVVTGVRVPPYYASGRTRGPRILGPPLE